MGQTIGFVRFVKFINFIQRSPNHIKRLNMCITMKVSTYFDLHISVYLLKLCVHASIHGPNLDILIEPLAEGNVLLATR